MGRRWIESEVKAIAQIRETLKKEFANRPQFPEVVGDRRILRFLRGKQHNIEEATKMIRDFLQWRLDNRVDDIRQAILYGGCDTPYKFPKGKVIIDLAPQIVLSVNALDRKGQPLSLEQFDFSPSKVFKAVTLPEYLVFLTYCLEYRALIMEEMSHEREKAYEASHPREEDREDGYGVIVMDFIIRDLKGVGMAHLGSEGRSLVAAALKLGLPNYQEYMGKSHMVNVPWIFSGMWYFVKGILDEFTLAKLTLSGSDYMDTLLQEVPFESIPQCLGGGFKLYNEPYFFDYSGTGALHYPGCPEPPPRVEGRSPSMARRAEGPGRRRSRSGSNTLKVDVAPAEEPVQVQRTRRSSGHAAPQAASGISPLQTSEAGSVVSKRGGARLVCAAGRELRLLREDLSGVLRGAPVLSLLVASMVAIAVAAHGGMLLSLVLPVAPMYLVIALLFGEV